MGNVKLREVKVICLQDKRLLHEEDLFVVGHVMRLHDTGSNSRGIRCQIKVGAFELALNKKPIVILGNFIVLDKVDSVSILGCIDWKLLVQKVSRHNCTLHVIGQIANLIRLMQYKEGNDNFFQLSFDVVIFDNLIFKMHFR